MTGCLEARGVEGVWALRSASRPLDFDFVVWFQRSGSERVPQFRRASPSAPPTRWTLMSQGLIKS